MPDQSLIVSLRAGPLGARARAGAAPRVRPLAGRLGASLGASSWRFPRRAAPAVRALAYHVAASARDPFELALAASAYERLASLTLSRRMGPLGESPIESSERARLLRDAGMPRIMFANAATAAVFASSGESLAKGNVLGSIGKAINKASVAVKKALTPVSTVLSTVGRTAMSVGDTAITDVGTLLNNADNDVVTGVSKLGSQLAANPTAILGAAATGGASLGLGDLTGLIGGDGSGGGTDETSVYPDSSSSSAPSSSVNWAALEPYALAGGGLLAAIMLYRFATSRRRR